MKKNLLAGISLLMLLSCAPKIKTSIAIKGQTPLTYSDLVVVLNDVDTLPATALKIGSVKAGDKGLSVNCSYAELMALIKEKSRNAGANVIKITRKKDPDWWSTCYRFSVDLYKVDNIKDLEKEIVWKSNRKLTWDDFRGKKRDDEIETSHGLAAAATWSGIQAEAGSTFRFAMGKITVTAIFNKNKSWVDSKFKTPEVLAHEQAHFDLSELYARKVRKELRVTVMSNVNGAATVDFIYRKYWKELQEYQDAYDKETKHGK